MFILPHSELDKSRPRVIAACAWMFLISGIILMPVSAAPLMINFKHNAWACFTLVLGPLFIAAANRMWAGYDEFFLLGFVATLPLVPVGIGIVNAVLCVKGFQASRKWWPDEEEIWGEDAHIPAKVGGMSYGRKASSVIDPASAEPSVPVSAAD